MGIPNTPNSAPKKKDDYVERLFKTVHSGRVGFIRGWLLDHTSKAERMLVLEHIGVCFFCGEDLLTEYNYYTPAESKRRLCNCVGARMARASEGKRKSESKE